MVAIVAGNDLGLGNTSLTQLGQAQGGQATIGQGQVGQYVNIATGNLVLQNQDEGLIFDGLSLNVLRTYNSLGQFAGSQGWLFGFTRNVTGLTGTLNAAGSSISRIDDDGSAVTYAYNASLGVYVSSGQAGAQDTLAWDAANNQWTWTNNSTREQETYDATGRLSALANPDTGAHFTFKYQAGVLSSIVAGDGDTLSFSYTDGNLTGLSISEVPPGQSAAVVRQQLSYTYDAQGRLASVSTTLASDTNASGASYTTSYTYDGSSDRVASVSQSDGTVVSYTYAADANGNYRVATVTTGSGAAAQTMALNYSLGTDSTTVTDGLGRSWIYTYDASGHLTQVMAPAVNGANPTTQYAYDGNGNLQQMTDANGGITYSTYDASGNLLSVQDGAGNTVSYTYNVNDQVTSKTTYAIAAQGQPGQPDYVAPSGAQTTYYVYNANNQLAYTVDPLGSVTENDYAVVNGLAELVTTKVYLGAQFAIASFDASNPPSLQQLTSWVASSAVQDSLAKSSRVDYSYDVRGQLAVQTQWDTVDASGNGVLDAGAVMTTMTYDAHGRLLQTGKETGATRSVLQTTTYAYDGMGRVLSKVDALGNATTYVYDDSANTIAITNADGLTNLQVYNSAGILVSSTDATATLPVAPVVNQSPIVVTDSQGRQVASIAYQNLYVTGANGDGTWISGEFATITSYDGGSSGSVLYATPLTASQMASLGLNPTLAQVKAVLKPSQYDQVNATILNDQGSLVATVNYSQFAPVSGTPGEYVTTYATGTQNNSTTQLAHLLSLDDARIIASDPSAAHLQSVMTTGGSDQTFLSVSDSSGRQVAYVDYQSIPVEQPDGSYAMVSGEFLTTNTYDANGNITASYTYATPISVAALNALGPTPSVAQLTALVSASNSDQISLSIRDSEGHLLANVSFSYQSYLPKNPDGSLATVSGELAVVYAYDSNGNQIQAKSYGVPLTYTQVMSLAANPTMDELNSLLTPSSADQTSYFVYDGNHNLVASVSPQLAYWGPNPPSYGEVVNLMHYDASGRRTSYTQYITPLTSEQFASLGDNPTLQQVQALVQPYTNDWVFTSIYDSSGRQVASVTPQVNYTTNPDGSTTATVGEYVSTTSYASNGDTISIIQYATPLTPAQLEALGDAPSMADLAPLLVRSPQDQVILNIFNSQGAPVAQINYTTNYIPNGNGAYTAVTGEFATTYVDQNGNPSPPQTTLVPLGESQMATLEASPTLTTLNAVIGVLPTFKQETHYLYDGSGRLLASVQSDGSASFMFYNSAGQVAGSVDSSGLVTSYVYDGQGRVTQEVVYASPVDTSGWIANGALSATIPATLPIPSASAGDQISDTLYDATGDIAATISPDGVVVESTYGATGKLASTTTYASALTPTQVAGLGGSPTLDTLASILTTSSADQTTYFIYDANGRLYGTIGPTGLVATNTYDNAGRIIAVTQHVTPLSASAVAAVASNPSPATLSSYLTSSPSDTTTLTIYDANGRVFGVVSSAGKVTLSNYNDAGELTSTNEMSLPLTSVQLAALVQAPSVSALQADIAANESKVSTPTNNNVSGSLAVSQDDQAILTIRSTDGSVVATLVQGQIDLYGNPNNQINIYTVSIQRMDASGNVLSSIIYANPLSEGQAQFLESSPSIAALLSFVTPSSRDNVHVTIVDSSGRVLGQVASNAAPVINEYDASGNLISSLQYAQRLSQSELDTLAAAPTMADLQGLVSASPSTRNVFLNDASGHRVGQVVSGVATVMSYDSGGNLIRSTTYSGTISQQEVANLLASPSLANLLMAVQFAESDSSTQTLYNPAGQTIATISPAGQVTTFAYDANGNLSRSTTYVNALSHPVDYIANYAQLLTEVSPSEGDQSTWTVYDAQNRPVAAIDASGDVTLTSYTNTGSVASVTKYADALSASQLAELGPQPSLSQVDAFLGHTSRVVYDAAGQAVATIDPNGSTFYTLYDAQGHTAATVNADGDVTTYVRDAAGHVTQVTQYATALSGADLESLAQNPTWTGLSPMLSASGADRTTTSIYNAAGQVVAAIDPMGNVTTTSYDGAGDVLSTIAYATPLSAQQMSALGTTPTLTALEGVLTGNAADRTTLMIYDANGRLVAKVDADGNVTTTRYDGAGNAVLSIAYATALTASQRAALGTAPSLTALMADVSTTPQDQIARTYYDGAGRVVAEIDADGYLTTVSYDETTNTHTSTRYGVALSAAQSVALTGAESVSSLVGLLGGSAPSESSSVTYDADGQVASRTAADGTTTSYFYDAVGNVINETVTPVAGQGQPKTTTFVYDAYGNLIKTIDPTGATTAAIYDADGQKMASADANGNVTWYYYDAAGRLTYKVEGEPGDQLWPLGNVTAYSYDAFGEVTSTTTYANQLTLAPAGESNGLVLNTSNATLAQVAAAVALLGNSASDPNDVTLKTYTADGQLASETDGDGYLAVDTYNAFGELTQTQKQVSQPGTPLNTANSTTTVYGYDNLGDQLSETDGVGTSVARTMSVTYDAFGRVTSRTDGNGGTTTYGYDNLGRQITSNQWVQGSERSALTTYDAFGNVLTQTDAMGNTTTYQYDIATHTTTVRTPGGVTMVSVRDAYGDTVSVTDGAGNTTSYAYDADGRATSVTDPLGHVSTKAYDGDGNLVQVTDATGYSVQYFYDSDGRVLAKVEDPNHWSNETDYQYDGQGRQVAVTDPNGVTTAFTFDAVGNVLTQVQDVGGLNQTTTYTYDGAGHVLTVTVGAGSSIAATTQYLYDALGRLSSKIVDPNGLKLTTSYVYDANDHLVQVTDPDGNTTYTVYNEAGEAVYVVSPAGAQGAGTGALTQHWYDADGRIVSTRTYAHLVATSSFAALASEPTALALSQGASAAGIAASTSDAVTYSVYDTDGRLIYSVDPLGAVTEIRYNALGQVAETLAYATPITMTAGLAFELQSGGAVASDIQSALGAAGNADSTARVAFSYYDADGRLQFSASIRSVDGVDGVVVTQTQYDAGGRVVADITYGVPLALAQVSAGTSADAIAAAVVAVNTPATTRTTQYIYDTAGRLTAKVDPDGNASFTFYDNDGNVIATVDGAGAVVEYAYDNLGRVVGKASLARTVDTSDWLIDGALAPDTPSWAKTDEPTVNAATDRLVITSYDALGRVAMVSTYSEIYVGRPAEAPIARAASSLTFSSTSNLSLPLNGEVVSYTYDAASRLTQESDFDLSLSSATRTTRYFYDNNGSEVAKLDASGYLTTYAHDAAGHVVGTVAYSTPVAQGLASTGSLVQLMPAQSSQDEATTVYYDGLGHRVGELDAGGYFTAYVVDADGNLLSTTRYATALSQIPASVSVALSLLSGSSYHQTARTYDVYGDVISSQDANGVTTDFTYDPAGNVLSTTVGVGSADARTTSSTYDAFGNVVTTVDALGHTTTYTYDLAGNQMSATDAIGNTTWYAYDTDNRLAYVMRGVASSGGVANAFAEISSRTYDAFGDVIETEQLASLVTVPTGFEPSVSSMAALFSAAQGTGASPDVYDDYTYDQVGDLVIFDDGNDNETGYAYDGFGDRIAQRDTVDQSANINSYAFNVYDQDGRLAYAIDGDGYVTGYQYNAYGEQVAVTRYATKVDLSSLPGWHAGSVVESSQMASLLETSSADRTITTTYDREGNKLTVTQPAVTYTNADGSTAVGSPVTQYTYDAYGNVTSESVLVQGTPGQAGAIWATTYNYYDALGHRTMTVDPMGYVTADTYDVFGEVLSETQYATAIGTQGLVAGGTAPSLPPTGVASTTGLDRVTTYTYDANGNKASESVQRSYVNAQGVSVVGFDTTTYGYDADNRLTTVTENGNTVTTAYDALGRITSVTGPIQNVLVSNWQALIEANPSLTLASASLYTTDQQVVSYQYDALGNKIVETQGSLGSSQSVSTYYRYDEVGQVVAEVTPLNGLAPDWTSDQVKTKTYDGRGNEISESYTLTGDDGSTVVVTTTQTYDANNQLTGSVTLRSGAATPDKSTATSYDAFGEAMTTGDGAAISSSNTYDNAGRLLTATDPKTGEVHTYGYNLAGQKVTDTVPLAASVGGTVATIYTLDLDGRVVAEQAPSTSAASGENGGVLHASYDAWGNVLSSADANGNTISYTYNERNQVVSETEAAVTVVGLNGVASSQVPVKTNGYDIEGNRVSATDENGNTTTTVYNAVGQEIASTDGAGAITYYGYDALGNQVASQDGNGNIHFTNVDALGRTVQSGEFLTSADGQSRQAVWQQAYVLDQNGNRIISYDGIGSAYLQTGDATDAALHANYDGYDSQGHVIWSQDAAQRAASTQQQHVGGGWTQAPANGDFELGNTGWTLGPGWQIIEDGQHAYAGQGYAQYSGTGSAEILNNDLVPVIPGQSITAQGAANTYANASSANAAYAGVVIVWYDANGLRISESSGTEALGGDGSSYYKMTSVTASAPDGAAYAQLGMVAGQGSAWVDTVSWNYVPPASTPTNGGPVVISANGVFTDQPTNQDFEQGDVGWTKGTGWTINQANNAANGNWVGNYTGTGTAQMINQDRVPVTAGQVITGSAQVSLNLAPDGADAAAGVIINWYDANGNLIGTSQGNVISSDHKGAWETSTVIGTAPAGAAYASIGVSGYTNGIGGLEVDGVRWNYQYIPQAPTGVVQNTYVYDMDGNLVGETTGNGDAEKWQYNAYGQAISHTDLSGAQYQYTYDANTGREVGESDNWSPAAQGQTAPTYVTGPIGTPNSETLTYDADGQVASETYSDGSSYSYQYDASGNLVREEDTTYDGNNNLVHTVTQTTYDSHNRISQVVVTNEVTGAVSLSESFSYDAAGNRREVAATSNGTTQQAWYIYDGDNRVLVSDGSLVNGQIVVTSSANSYAQAYDNNGNVVNRTTQSASGDIMIQHNIYNAQNELTQSNYAVDQTTGGASRGVEETITYDADGHALVTEQFYALGTTVGSRSGEKVDPDDPRGDDGDGTSNVGGELDNVTVDFYDAVGRLAEEQTFANPSNWDGSGASLPTSAPTINETTFGSLQLQSEAVYQGPNGTSGYDADGNVVGYQYRDNTGRIDQYQVSYLKKDGYLQADTEGQNVSNTPNVQPATDVGIYDTRGNEVALEQHTEDPYSTLADTIHVFAYNGDGEIIERQDGTGVNGTSLNQGSSPATQVQNYTYVNGQQLAHYDNAGTLDVLSNVTAFSSNNDSPNSYVVQAGDTLESIAQAQYGDPSLWHVLAQANDLSSDTNLVLGQRLQIPSITTHNNSATTFKPYNPGSIVGSTTPNLPTIAPPPPPASQHCNVLADIIVTAVQVVASYYLGPVLGSIAGQLAGDALGVHHGISVAEIGQATLTAVIADGVDLALGPVGTAAEGAEDLSTIASDAGDIAADTSDIASDAGDIEGTLSSASSGWSFTDNLVRGAASYVGNDVAAKLTGQPAHFSWAGLVASSLSSGAAGELGPTPSDIQRGDLGPDFLGNIGARAVGDVVDREASVALGDRHVNSWRQVGEDVAGNVLANAAIAGTQSSTLPASDESSPLAVNPSMPWVSQLSAYDAYKSGQDYQFDFTGGGQGVGDSMADAINGDMAFAEGYGGRSQSPLSNSPQVLSTDEPTRVQPGDVLRIERNPDGSYSSWTEHAQEISYTSTQPYSGEDDGLDLPPIPAVDAAQDLYPVTVNGITDLPLPDQVDALYPVSAESTALGTIRGMSDTEAFFTSTRLGQFASGVGHQLQALATSSLMINPLAAPVVLPEAVSRLSDHYAQAYGQGQLGDTLLQDAGNTVHGLVMSTPLGFIKALNEKNTMGGMERLGSSSLDAAMWVVPTVAGKIGEASALDEVVPSTAAPNIVYRALNAGDEEALNLGQDLMAKAPDGTWTAAEHIANAGPGTGGAAANSPWISTTRSLEVAQAYDSGSGIVAIDLNQVNSPMVELWTQAPSTLVGGTQSIPYWRSVFAQEVTVYQTIPRSAVIGWAKTP